MKILFGIQSFESLTGSELYVFDFGKELVSLGNEVTVAAKYINGLLTEKAKLAGIRVVHLFNLPEEKFDVLHLNQYQPAKILTAFYPFTPSVMAMHTEVYAKSDIPLVHPNIQCYICVREEIRKIMLSKYHLPEEKLIVSFNGIDSKRFNPSIRKTGQNQIKNILIVGTINHLRIKILEDLAERSIKEKIKIIVVGNAPVEVILRFASNPLVEFHEPTFEIEKFLSEADETAGILMGRSTIEGWFAGIPGWIYAIDNQGNILSKALHQPPSDMGSFSLGFAVNKMIAVFKESISAYPSKTKGNFMKHIQKRLFNAYLQLKYRFVRFKQV
jgi:glycosyltransferase involved in cell wall biosynthesis